MCYKIVAGCKSVIDETKGKTAAQLNDLNPLKYWQPS
jgi:hypothetical protein